LKLSDLRKVAVKKHLRIRFPLSNGMECVVNEHGIAQVPALRATPAFNLEQELAAAQSFLVEAADAGRQSTVKPEFRRYSLAEMTALTTAGAAAEASPAEHDD